MGMGKTGIPWDSHGNGNTISHGNGNGMGMGIRRMGMGIKTWEWEKITTYCTYSKLCDSREFMGSERKSVLRKLYTVARQVLCVPASSAASERLFTQTPFDSQPSRAPLRCRAGVICISIKTSAAQQDNAVWSLVTALRSASCSVPDTFQCCDSY